MIDDTAKSYLYTAVRAECEKAIERNGQFHSHHEAWAVLQEEIEEVEDAYRECANKINDIMPELWRDVRQDKVSENCKDDLLQIKVAALEVACECIQVAAMCDKWDSLISSNEDKPEENAGTKFLNKFLADRLLCEVEYVHTPFGVQTVHKE